MNLDTAKFLWYKYYFNILSRLTNTSVAKREMLECVRVFHKGQTDAVKRSCEEFERAYDSNDILKWYTRDSFCYLLYKIKKKINICDILYYLFFLLQLNYN